MSETRPKEIKQKEVKETRKVLLRKRMEELKIEAKKAFGQNFLISNFVIEKIISKVEEFDRRAWCEIGPGLGALTEDLIKIVKDFRVIELDGPIIEYWRTRGLNVIDQDALRAPWKDWPQKEPMGLVSNLPYQISTSLVIELCITEHPFDRLILMFQKEVAERLTSKHREGSYGLLSVMAQLHWQMKKVCDAAPGDFFPAPKIASRVVAFERKASAPSIEDSDKLLGLLKGVFTQRRKILKKTIGIGWPHPLTDQKKDEVWEKMSLKKDVRAEELTPEQWFALYQLLR